MTLTAKSIHWLETVQRSMEKAMIGVSKRGHIGNAEIRRKTGISNTLETENIAKKSMNAPKAFTGWHREISWS